MPAGKPYLTGPTALNARSFALVAAGSVVVLCSIVLLGWWLHVDLFILTAPGLPGMKANAGVAAMLIAVACVLTVRAGGRRTNAVVALCAIAAAIGLATVLQYLSGLDFGIDQLLLDDWVTPGARHPGRMSPMGAVAITLLAASLLARSHDRRLYPLGQAGAVIGFIIGLLGTIGLVYHFRFLTGLADGLASMSVTTALSLMLLGIAVLCIEPETGLMRTILADRGGGRFARRVLPIAIAFPVVVGWLRILGQLEGYYDAQFGILIMVLSSIFVFSLITVISAAHLNTSEDALLQAQAELEQRVQDRTRELESTVSRLRESEERFRSLTVLSSDWYWEQDENFRFTVQSGGMKAALDISAEQALGKTRWELPYDNMTEAAWEQHRQHLKARRPFYDLELIRRLEDGSYRYAHVSGEPVYDSRGAFRGYRGTGRDITARRRAEIAAASSRKFLESVIEAIPEPVFLKDASHRWVLFNSAFCELMGRERAELAGQTDTLLFPPERVKQVWAEDDAVLTGPEGELVVEEQALPRPDGSVRWMLKSKRRVTLPDDSTYIVGVSADVTRLKQVQDALRTSEELHRLLADNSSDLISLLTPAGAIEYASPASDAMLGRNPVDLAGRVVAEIIHPEDAGQALRIFKEVVKTQMPMTFTCRLQRSDGSWSWIETSFRAIRDAASGLTRQVIGISRDVNERVRVTNALNHFKYVLDNTLDMIFIYDVDSLRFGYVNEGAARALGIPRERLIGMAPWEIRADIEEKDYYASIEPFLSGRIQSRQVETVHQRADGSVMPVEVTMQIIRRPGEVDTFISIARDLTERKKIEQMKNEFVSTVSHELRTPVTSIRGSLGLLAGGVAGELPQQARQLIDIASSNSERLIRLINDILDIEKIESGKMRFVIAPVALRALLGDALQENQGYAERFSVRFRTAGEIPDVIVRADRDRVLQVMANLLSNAAKFSPPGAEVQVSATAGSGSVRISVSDRGGGIPAEFHDKIFAKFSQADASDSRKLGGTGLGLSIAKAIVEKHGGEIGFRSAQGEGTTFHFDLPLALGAPQADGGGARPAPNEIH